MWDKILDEESGATTTKKETLETSWEAPGHLEEPQMSRVAKEGETKTTNPVQKSVVGKDLDEDSGSYYYQNSKHSKPHGRSQNL